MNTPGDPPEVDPYATNDPVPCSAATPPAQPQQIGRYRVEKILGEGGFGRVYLAHDDKLSRAVAIKVPHSRLGYSPRRCRTLSERGPKSPLNDHSRRGRNFAIARPRTSLHSQDREMI